MANSKSMARTKVLKKSQQLRFQPQHKKLLGSATTILAHLYAVSRNTEERKPRQQFKTLDLALRNVIKILFSGKNAFDQHLKIIQVRYSLYAIYECAAKMIRISIFSSQLIESFAKKHFLQQFFGSL